MKKILGLVIICALCIGSVEAVPKAGSKRVSPAGGPRKVATANKAPVAKQAALAGTAEEPMLSFKKSDCRKIEGTPNIVICVEGDAGEGELNLNTLRSLKGATKNLITKYRAKSAKKAGARKASMTMGMTDEQCMSYYMMSCADYDSSYAAMMMNTTTTNITTTTDPETMCQQMYSMSCADYAATNTTMTTTTTTDPETMCQQMYSMSCADYAATNTTNTTNTTITDPETMCQIMYGMSCADYANMMIGNP